MHQHHPQFRKPTPPWLHPLRRKDRRRGHHFRPQEKELLLQHLADPDGDLTGAQGEEKHKGEEHRRKEEQIQPLRRIRAQKGRDTGREGNGGTSRDGEERADGQVEQAGGENAVALADLAGERLKSVGVRDTDGGDAEDGNADRRDDKADDRGQGILPCHLAEMDGEDQVSGPEEHSEQCSGNKNFLPER